MSTDEEIADVFYSDIASLTHQVYSRSGIYPFLEDFDGYSIEGLIELHPDDGELLQRILDKDREENG